MLKTINEVQFEISEPYAAGHQINEAEAKVLNQTRAENIGNNLRAKLKETADVEEQRRLVAEKDAEYVFTLAEARASRVLDPVEREALKIAKELLRENLAEKGRKLKDVPEGLTEEEWEDKVAAELDRIASAEQVQKVAKKRVEDRRKQGESIRAALEASDI